MHSKIIANRGWIKRRGVIRPKTRLFTVLSLIWCAVSVTPARLLILHQVASISDIGFVCWTLILPHPVFILLALFFRLTERETIVEQMIPDPNYDLHRMDHPGDGQNPMRSPTKMS